MIAAQHAFDFWTWLGHFTGVSNESGPGYGFFSGIGSDIGEVAILGGVVQLYRHRNCREQGCWRLGLHTYNDEHGQPHPACRGHHPHMGPGYRFSFAGLHAANLAAAAPPAAPVKAVKAVKAAAKKTGPQGLRR